MDLRTNDFKVSPHFRLREFQNREGLVILCPALVDALEATHVDIAREVNDVIYVVITCGTRTSEDNVLLAERLGWIDEGGVVARNSKHLPKHGGIAADFIVVYKNRAQVRVDLDVVSRVIRKYFDWVKDDYSDGHVHGDMRDHV